MAGPPPFQVGMKIPKLVGSTQLGAIKLHDFIDGAWALLVTFPQDFHPVWATELGMLAKLKPQFDVRNCRVLGLSIGSLKEQARFIEDVNETQDVQVNFPIFADESGLLSRMLGLVHATAPAAGTDHGFLPYSAAYIIDVDMAVRFVFQYPMSIGRNLYEFIRVLDGLQLAAYNQIVLPTNWKINDDVFVEPDITSDAAKALFPNGFHEIKPYFRVTPAPVISEDQ
ncbi:peroxidase [Achlya hypogyna]|uniref:Peroxidase n=1 Tax=Achlya hypogyna TaxID=1202772 RepID=A0A1V9ZBB8_ACHHY|nr:peroxidase [Achlya hypogyna]